MLYQFHTTYISVDLAHYEINRAKVCMGGITQTMDIKEDSRLQF